MSIETVRKICIALVFVFLGFHIAGLMSLLHLFLADVALVLAFFVYKKL